MRGKLTYELVTGIKKLYTHGMTQARIARLFELSPTTIMRLVKADFQKERYSALLKKEQRHHQPFVSMISRNIRGIKSVVYAKKGV